MLGRPVSDLNRGDLVEAFEQGELDRASSSSVFKQAYHGTAKEVCISAGVLVALKNMLSSVLHLTDLHYAPESALAAFGNSLNECSLSRVLDGSRGLFFTEKKHTVFALTLDDALAELRVAAAAAHVSVFDGPKPDADLTTVRVAVPQWLDPFRTEMGTSVSVDAAAFACHGILRQLCDTTRQLGARVWRDAVAAYRAESGGVQHAPYSQSPLDFGTSDTTAHEEEMGEKHLEQHGVAKDEAKAEEATPKTNAISALEVETEGKQQGEAPKSLLLTSTSLSQLPTGGIQVVLLDAPDNSLHASCSLSPTPAPLSSSVNLRDSFVCLWRLLRQECFGPGAMFVPMTVPLANARAAHKMYTINRAFGWERAGRFSYLPTASGAPLDNDAVHTCADVRRMWRVIGTLIGFALCVNIRLGSDVKLSCTFWKQILGHCVIVDDLDERVKGSVRAVELTPFGPAVEGLDGCETVLREAKDADAHVLEALLCEGTAQISVIREGFNDVVPPKAVRLMTASELEQALCG